MSREVSPAEHSSRWYDQDMLRSCRLCSSTVNAKHSVALFSSDSSFPNQLSSIIDLPVVASDGLSHYICRPCNRKFLAAECFRSTAKTSYEKEGFQVPGLVSPQNSPKRPLDASRKRTKDTGGIDTSPCTSQCRPLAKRSTTGVPGKRLAFPPRENCETAKQVIFLKCYTSRLFQHLLSIEYRQLSHWRTVLMSFQNQLKVNWEK